MKKIVMAAVLAGSVSLNLQAADPVTVNGVAIDPALVDYIVKQAQAQGRAVDEQARTGILEKLVISEVIDQEAKKSGVASQPDFLAMERLTTQELRVNAYLEDYVRKHPVDDGAVQAEYDRLKAQPRGKEYKASHILLNTEQEARDVIAKLGEGADFAQLARERSQDGSREAGGDLGWFALDGMVQAFADGVAALQKGAYTGAPVQSEFGWHVIRLEDTREMAPPALEAIKDRLQQELQRRQLDLLVRNLRAKATVANLPAAR